MKYCLSAAAGALALSLTTLTAQAAPAGSLGSDMKAAMGENGAVEKATYGRRCGWYHGRWHCRHHYRSYRYYDEPYYYYGGPSYYYGGPSFGFRYGGHRYHRHDRWRY